MVPIWRARASEGEGEGEGEGRWGVKKKREGSHGPYFLGQLSIHTILSIAALALTYSHTLSCSLSLSLSPIHSCSLSLRKSQLAPARSPALRPSPPLPA